MKNLNPLFEAIKDLSMDYPKPGWFTRTFRPEKAKRMQQDRDDVARRVRDSIGRPDRSPKDSNYDLTRADAYVSAAKPHWGNREHTYVRTPNLRRSNNGKRYKGETRFVDAFPYGSYRTLLK